MTSMKDNIYGEINREFVEQYFPRRKANTHKGSYGTVSLFVGSKAYRGAAHLALGAALRAGAGYVRFVGEDALMCELRMKYPEALYSSASTDDEIVSTLAASSSVVIGSGSGVSMSLADITGRTVKGSRGRVLVDADAINSIASFGGINDLSTPDSRVILTPHPLEFSRISGLDISEISADRISTAKAFAAKYRVTLLLKGHRTVVTDGERVLVNTTGSPALSKGGSGDVLSGLIGALAAYITDPLIAAALGAYLHGAAADILCREYSTLGVTPSDLPREIARIMASIERKVSPVYYT